MVWCVVLVACVYLSIALFVRCEWNSVETIQQHICFLVLELLSLCFDPCAHVCCVFVLYLAMLGRPYLREVHPQHQHECDFFSDWLSLLALS